MTVSHLEPIYSSLGGDADLGQLVEMFVDEMPQRIADLLDRLHTFDWPGLRIVAHQLKGSAGSHGFPLISPAAARLEDALRQQRPYEEIRQFVNEVVELCRCVRAGRP